MDVRRLELLRELAVRGSVTAVARATHRTPSAVSQQLKQLERESGVQLVERVGRGVVLTDAGRALARTAEDIAVATRRAEALWDAYLEAPAGRVTVAVFPTAGRMFLPDLLTAAASVPGLELVIADVDPVLADFPRLTTDFDVVVAHSPDGALSWRDANVAIVPLMREPLDIAVAPESSLALLGEVTPADLIGHDWIGVPTGFPFHQVVRDIERITGEAVRVVQRFSDIRIIEALVAAGHGIAVLPRYTSGGPGSDVELRPLVGAPAQRSISALARRDQAERPSVQRVIAELRAIAGRISAADVPGAAQRH